MKLSLTQFTGERPVVAKSLLPENAASETLNARMEGGSLVPINTMSDTAFVANSFDNSFYLLGSGAGDIFTRFDFSTYVKGPIANDLYDRVYAGGQLHKPQVGWSNAGTFEIADLGIKKPDAPVVMADAGTPAASDYQVFTSYYITQVTERGEESEPSDPTEAITRWDGSTSTVVFPTLNDPRAAFYRVYRTEGAGTFNFVGQFTALANTPDYADVVFSADLGSPCETENHNHPPEKLENLISIGNGVLAGYFDNTLCFSEPYKPHAWPIDYQLAFPDDIMGIGSLDGSIAVTTKGNPWIVSGSHPSVMNQARIDEPFACVSKRGLVDMGGFVLYPSSEGIAYLSVGGSKIITRNIYSKNQWLALTPSSVLSFRYRDKYLCFTDTASFIFDPEHGTFPINVLSASDAEVLSGHYDAIADKLNLLIRHSDNTRSVKVFDDAVAYEMKWVSREFIIPKGLTFPAARVDADSGFVFKISEPDGPYSYEVTRTDDFGFRLPSGRARSLQITLKSTSRINSAAIASSMSEVL